METKMRRWVGAALMCGLVACGANEDPAQLGVEAPGGFDASGDASSVTEALDAVIEADTFDVADTPPDDDGAAPQDVERPLEPEPSDDASSPAEVAPVETAWGRIEAPCGALAEALLVGGPSIHQGTYQFTDDAGFDPTALTGKRRQRFDEPNAGGSSRCGEVMSMQYLVDCEGMSITKTEVEMVYDTPGKIADFLARSGDVDLGVSVTRAYKGPVIDTYSEAEAADLLTDKLAGLAEARVNVNASDLWSASMLHVWTLRDDWAALVASAWESLSPEVKGQIHLVITVEQGSAEIVTDGCDD